MKKKEKIIYVARSKMPKKKIYEKYLSKLWDSRILTNNGYYHQLLEKKLKEYLNVSDMSIFTNGHIALEYALESIGKRGEIITSPFTFVSTTQAIIRTGNIPVFCDVKDDYTIDESKITALINENTIAIVPIHVYGNICNVEEIGKIAVEYNLPVIYDAAHVFGVNYKNKSISHYGDISMFSFHSTKVFHTIEGGALILNNSNDRDKIEQMKNFGQFSPEIVNYIGGNGKMDEFRAIMGLCNLETLNSDINQRKRVYDRYLSHLKGVQGIKLNYVQTDVSSNYAYFPVLFEKFHYDRDEVFDLLKENGINGRKYFYPITSEFKPFINFSVENGTPNARYFSQKVLCLPIYPELSNKDVDRICEIILRRKSVI